MAADVEMFLFTFLFVPKANMRFGTPIVTEVTNIISVYVIQLIWSKQTALPYSILASKPEGH